MASVRFMSELDRWRVGLCEMYGVGDRQPRKSSRSASDGFFDSLAFPRWVRLSTLAVFPMEVPTYPWYSVDGHQSGDLHMTDNMRRTAKWTLPVFVPALLAGMVLGGWRIWQYASTRRNDAARAKSRARAPSSNRGRRRSRILLPWRNRPPNLRHSSSRRRARVQADDTKTAKSTGKKHEREENLLLIMAMHLHSEAYERFIRQKGFGMNRLDADAVGRQALNGRNPIGRPRNWQRPRRKSKAPRICRLCT